MTLCCVFIFAQKSVSGRITDAQSAAVAGASVTVENPENSVIIAYAISDSKGNYKLTFNSTLDKVRVRVKAFNQKTQSREVSNADQTLNFSLTSDVTEIQEVTLKTKLITKRGDTITYDLKSFESKSDRTLADVLNKVPGMEVAADGSVQYQGKPLAKFYVEGKDLMEGGYGALNKSLPKDAVAKVEVMENHQPVKILQDKVPSENAALNIRLKKSVTMTGRGEAGIGGSPLLWNVKLTPMVFSKNYQWVLNYKANNNGEQVENEGNMFAFGGRFEGFRRSIQQENWLSVENASTPAIPAKRYLMNNVHFLSANMLTNLSKEWELKANASYTNNVVERESQSSTTYTNYPGIAAGTTVVNRFTNHFYTNQGKAELIFSKNAKKGFFKNTTTFNGFWNDDRAEAFRQNPDETGNVVNRNSHQSLGRPSNAFQNSLSTIIPWGERMVNVMSYISYQDDKQDLNVTPGSYLQSLFELPAFGGALLSPALYATVAQDLRVNTFDSRHSASVGFGIKRFTISPEVGFNYTTNRLETDLYAFNQTESPIHFGDAAVNDLRWVRSQPYVSTRVDYKGQRLSFSLSLPVNFNHLSGQDAARDVNRSLDRLTFEPSLFANYDFASFWKARAGGNINHSFGDLADIYGGYILFNASSLNRKNNPILESDSKSFFSAIEYRNPLNNLFGNVRYSINGSSRNLMFDEVTSGSGQSVIIGVERRNTSLTQSVSTEIGKYFPNFKTNASVTYRLSSSESDRLYNGELSEMTSRSQGMSVKFNNTYFKWMSLDYLLNLGWSSNDTRFGDTRSSNWNHALNAFFYPADNHTVGFTWDDMSSTSAGKTYRNKFFDASYQYTWAAKKIDFELKWLNIANTKFFERISDNALMVTQSSIRIRPSQLMFTVKFNFK